MKTTIEIPDALAAEAKEVARAEHSTLRELVVAGLRAELKRRRDIPAVDFHFPTVSGQGLAPGLAPAAVIAASYDLPA